MEAIGLSPTATGSTGLFLEKIYLIMRKAFLAIAILIVIAVYLVISYFLGNSSEGSIRVWYFIGIIAYLGINAVIISKKNDFNQYRFLLRINFFPTMFLLLGFIFNFFFTFPLTLRVIFGWPSLVTAMLFIFLAFFAGVREHPLAKV